MAGGWSGTAAIRASAEFLKATGRHSFDSEWKFGPTLPKEINRSFMVEDPRDPQSVILVSGINEEVGVDKVTDSIFRISWRGKYPETTWEELPQKVKVPRHAFEAMFVPDHLVTCQPQE